MKLLQISFEGWLTSLYQSQDLLAHVLSVCLSSLSICQFCSLTVRFLFFCLDINKFEQNFFVDIFFFYISALVICLLSCLSVHYRPLCQFICWFVRLPVYILAYLTIELSICLIDIFVYFSSVTLSVYMFICQFICYLLYFCLSVYLPFYLCLCIPMDLSNCLSTCLFICLCVYFNV